MNFRSHEGLVPFTVFQKKTQLTGTHPSYLSMLGITLVIVQEKLLRWGDSQSRIAWDQIYIRAL